MIGEIKMYAIERFTLNALIIILLTIYACFYVDNPYYMIILSGIMLCIVCKESLEEKNINCMLVIRYILALIFVLYTDVYISYLLFYICSDYNVELDNKKKYKIFMPAIIYFFENLISHNQNYPLLLLHTIVLILISTVIFFVQYFIEKYLSAKNSVLKAVSVMAVNEMYANKLNQELIIKNYLTDKNARLEERENISRNIHNSVGYSITAAVMTLDAADMLFDVSPEKAREKINIANKRIRGSLESIRQAVRVLDNENKYIAINDFICELTTIIDNFVIDSSVNRVEMGISEINIYTNFENVNTDVVIPHEHTEFLTGALGEFLSNGVRHGKATEFIVTLIADSSNLKLKVVDNGKSDFSNSNEKERIEKGFGIKKMMSYVKKCGGEMSIFNENGFNQEITIRLFERGNGD